MKKNGKLSLNKETVTKLNQEQLGLVFGGAEEAKSKTTKKSCPGGICGPIKTTTTQAPASSPQNPQTCQGNTCIFIDGCS